MNKNKRFQLLVKDMLDPLSIELAKKFKNVIGYEKSFKRFSQLKKGLTVIKKFQTRI